MSPNFSYIDAVHVLTDEMSGIFKLLDRLAGGMFLSVNVAGDPQEPTLFDNKRDFIDLSDSLWSGLADNVQDLGRFMRNERIAAAHAIIVVTSYLETISIFDNWTFWANDPVKFPDDRWFDVPKPMIDVLSKANRQQLVVERNNLRGRYSNQDLRDRTIIAEIDRKARKAFTGKIRTLDGSELRALIAALLFSDIPIPAAQRSYGQTTVAIADYCTDMARQMAVTFVGPGWNNLDPRDQENFLKVLTRWVPDTALSKYRTRLHRLATHLPEVAFWANNIDIQTTTLETNGVQVGFEGLERALNELSRGKSPSAKQRALSDYYKSALNRPIVETGELPSTGMRIPDLGTAYINPTFRSSDVEVNDHLHLESWWMDLSRKSRSNLQRFLLIYLTTAEAVRVPLLVLGQPGSGKSVLTKTLAARLPSDEFVTVRVSLRDVAAEADVQTQIEHALFDATGERTSWPDLIRSTGNALPVILLDGFDELLQATGVSQSDYLERVAVFQERESINRRPCVVIITSRTAVADRARIPSSGAIALRLEPFDEQQIATWLDVWNWSNLEYFRSHQLKDLPSRVVLSHPDLASQPLLLLMLALYDADGNALQNENTDLGHGQLYERLLSRFAEREVRKLHSNLSAEDMKQRIELELMRLSIAAIAMFNRGRQWVTQAELDDDLAALTEEEARSRKAVAGDFREKLSAGEGVLGKFFFIHEARAIVGGMSRGTIEFLHATFGEYLVSRIAAKELEDLAKTEEFASKKARRGDMDDAFLHALLSFAPLSARATTIEFLRDLIGGMPQRRREILRELLLSLFAISLDGRIRSKYDDYKPVSMHVPARCAAYSANLLLLTLLVGGVTQGSELFPAADDVINEWSRQALLWRSQLSSDGWDWLCNSITLLRVDGSSGRDIVLHPSFAIGDAGSLAVPTVQPEAQLYWAFERPYSSAFPQWSAGPCSQFQRRYQFTCDLDDEIVFHSLKPLFDKLGSTVTTFIGYSTDHSSSCAHALLKLWIASSTRAKTEELTAAYDECFELALNGLRHFDADAEKTFREVIVRQLAVDLKRLPGVWRDTTSEKLKRSAEGDTTWVTRVINSLGFAKYDTKK